MSEEKNNNEREKIEKHLFRTLSHHNVDNKNNNKDKLNEKKKNDINHIKNEKKNKQLMNINNNNNNSALSDELQEQIKALEVRIIKLNKN